MRTKTMAMTFALATGLLVPGALAQHEQHHSDQANAPADRDKTMMPGKIAQMMTTQQEVNTLASHLLLIRLTQQAPIGCVVPLERIRTAECRLHHGSACRESAEPRPSKV
jgi:hypothetical protein